MGNSLSWLTQDASVYDKMLDHTEKHNTAANWLTQSALPSTQNNGSALGYIAGSAGVGAASVFEGMGDLLEGTAAWITGDKEYAEYVYKNNVTGGWQQQLDESYNPGKGMQIGGQVASGVGQSLSYIGLTLLTMGIGGAVSGAAGASSAAPSIAAKIGTFAAQNAPIFLSATGSYTAEAVQTTGELTGKEMTYGILGGAMETGLEKLGAVGGTLGKITGTTGVAEKAFGKVIKNSIARGIISDAAGEFVEESLSELGSTALKRFTGVDRDATTSAREVLMAGTIGALSGGILGTGTTTIQQNLYKKVGGNIVTKGMTDNTINTANLLISSLKTDTYENVSQDIISLKDAVNSFSGMKNKTGFIAQAKLGEISGIMAKIEVTSAINAVKVRTMLSANDETAAKVNALIPKPDGGKWSVQEIKSNKDNITSLYAYAVQANNMINMRETASEKIEAFVKNGEAQPMKSNEDENLKDISSLSTKDGENYIVRQLPNGAIGVVVYKDDKYQVGYYENSQSTTLKYHTFDSAKQTYNDLRFTGKISVSDTPQPPSKPKAQKPIKAKTGVNTQVKIESPTETKKTPVKAIEKATEKKAEQKPEKESSAKEAKTADKPAETEKKQTETKPIEQAKAEIKKEIKKPLKLDVEVDNVTALSQGIKTGELEFDMIEYSGKRAGFTDVQRDAFVKSLIEGAKTKSEFIKTDIPYDGTFETKNTPENIARVLNELKVKVTQEVIFNKKLDAVLKKASKLYLLRDDEQTFIATGFSGFAIPNNSSDFAEKEYKAEKRELGGLLKEAFETEFDKIDETPILIKHDGRFGIKNEGKTISDIVFKTKDGTYAAFDDKALRYFDGNELLYAKIKNSYPMIKAVDKNGATVGFLLGKRADQKDIVELVNSTAAYPSNYKSFKTKSKYSPSTESTETKAPEATSEEFTSEERSEARKIVENFDLYDTELQEKMLSTIRSGKETNAGENEVKAAVLFTRDLGARIMFSNSIKSDGMIATIYGEKMIVISPKDKTRVNTLLHEVAHRMESKANYKGFAEVIKAAIGDDMFGKIKTEYSNSFEAFRAEQSKNGIDIEALSESDLEKEAVADACSIFLKKLPYSENKVDKSFIRRAYRSIVGMVKVIKEDNLATLKAAQRIKKAYQMMLTDNEVSEIERSVQMSLSNRYEAKQRYVDRLNEENSKIETLTEEQHSALSDVARMRHVFHSNAESLFNNSDELWKYISLYGDGDKGGINSALKYENLPTIEFPDTSDIPSSDDYALIWEDDGDYEDFDDWRENSGEYDRFYKQFEKINTIIEKYLEKIDKKHGTKYAPTGIARTKYSPSSAEGKGYIGKSMSVNASNAYKSGEMPISKWTKQEILESIYSLVDPGETMKFEIMTKDELQKTFLKRASWHHTGAFYNQTDFYSINDDKVTSTTSDDIDAIISERKPRVKRSQEEIDAENALNQKKAEEKAKKASAETLLPYTKYKTLNGFTKAIENGIVSESDINAVKQFRQAKIEERREELRQIWGKSNYYGLKSLPSDSFVEMYVKSPSEPLKDGRTVKDYLSKVKYSPSDSAYLEAVKKGDMQTAQKMVDEAAKKAGYTIKAYHGTLAKFNEFRFNPEDLGIHAGGKSQARTKSGYGKNAVMLNVVIKLNNPITFEKDFGAWDSEYIAPELLKIGVITKQEAEEILLTDSKLYKRGIRDGTVRLRKLLIDKGFDGFIYPNWFEGKTTKPSYAVFEKESIKKADPVTYDNNGNIIPLSKRFDTKKSDIRYSPSDYPEATNVDPNTIKPINEVEDNEKYKYLVSEFKKNGYSGRPIVVLGNETDSLAITGSHRIYAAREADIDIPTILIPFEYENYYRLNELAEASSDEERVSIANQLFEDGLISKTAHDLIVREDELNSSNFGVKAKDQMRYSPTVTSTTGKVVDKFPEKHKITVESSKTAYKEKKISFQNAFVNQQAGIESFLIGQGMNKDKVMGYVQAARAGEAYGQGALVNGQYDAGGNYVGESYHQILKPLWDSKKNSFNKELLLEYEEYALNLHNIDRWNQGKPVMTFETEESKKRIVELEAQAKELSLQAAKSAQSEEEEAAARKQVRDSLKEQIFEVKKEASIKESKKNINIYEKAHPEFVEIEKKMQTFHINLNKYRVDTGLISQETADELNKRYPHYLPTYREQDGASLSTASVRGRNNMEVNQSVKTAKGSDKPVENPILNDIRQTLATYKAGRVNQLMELVYDNADQKYIVTDEKQDEDIDDIAETDYEKAVDKTNSTLMFYKNGKKIAMKASANIFTGFEGFSSSSTWIHGNLAVESVAKINDIFKKLVTSWNPLFTFTNFMRDIQDAGIYTKFGSKFFTAYTKAVAEIQKNGAVWQEFIAVGGLQSSIYDYDNGFNGDVSKHGLKKATHKALILSNKMEHLGVMVEALPRLAEYMLSKEKGLSVQERLNNAADVTINFGRSGFITRKLNQTVMPFLNPAVQGLDKTTRVVFGKKTSQQWIALIAKAAILGILPMALSNLMYDDDDEYNDLRDTVKENNYLIKVGETWVKIPRGRILSVIAGAYNRTQRAIQGKSVDFVDYLSNVASQATPIDNITRTIFSPFGDVKTNTTWYGGTIESMSEQNKYPELRYDEYTSELSKAIGNAFNYSPKKIDYLIDQYSGIIGDVLLPSTSSSNMIERKFTVNAASSSRLSSEFYDAVKEATYMKNSGNEDGYYISKYLAEYKKAADELYDQIDTNDKEQTATIRALINQLYKTALTDAEAYKSALTAAKALSNSFAVAESEGKFAVTFEGNNFRLYDDKQSADKYLTSLIQKTVYTESLRLLYGAERALKSYDADLYEKATALNSLGITFDIYYNAYFYQRGRTKEDVEKYLKSLGLDDRRIAVTMYALGNQSYKNQAKAIVKDESLKAKLNL